MKKVKCRFCAKLNIDPRTGGPYCEEKDNPVSESYAKRVRICEHFTLVEIDWFLESKYKPVQKKIRKNREHLTTIYDFIPKENNHDKR